MVVGAVVLSGFAHAGVPIEVVHESQKLLASDGAADDRFGMVVVVNESYILVGSPFRDELGANSGAVYVFDAATRQELHKLVPDDGSANDQFGTAIAIDGEIAVVGAPKHDGAGADSGSAYIFDLASGDQLMKLTPSVQNAGSEFGAAACISDQYIAIGAPHENVKGFIDAGAVYVFDRVSGAEINRIFQKDPFVRGLDEFGSGVLIEGQEIYISAPFNEGQPMSSLHTGTIFMHDLLTGAYITKFNGQGVGHGDRFGSDFDIKGDRLYVSAAGAPPLIGNLFVFDLITHQAGDIFDAPVRTESIRYGTSISVWDSNLVSTNPYVNSGGWADARNTDTGQVFAQFLPTDLRSQDRFGQDTAAIGGQVFIGAPFDDDQGNLSGSVYVFDIPSFGPCSDADFAGPYYVLNFYDVSAFINAYVAGDPAADLDQDSDFDFLDVQMFITQFNSGCP